VACSRSAGAGPGRTTLLLSFQPEFRTEVRELARRSSCLADLAATFPGLLFALATGYGSLEARQAALGRVAAGAALKDVADSLGLPWWLRRLPPQAFTERLARLPDEADFSSRVGNLLPPAPGHAAAWLARVLQAYRTCGAEFALWVAKHDRPNSPLGSDSTLLYLAAWAWHSVRPETLGGRIVRRPWVPAMSLARALEEMAAWRKRIALALSLSAGGGGRWLDDGSAQGYEFVALRTIDDFIAESEAMDNCLDGFADKIDAGNSFVYSIRLRGRPVADVEIGSHPLDVNLPTIVQLRGPRNRRAGLPVWRATYAWLGEQTLRQRPPRKPDPRERRRALRSFWKPYLATLGVRDRSDFERLTLEAERIQMVRSRPRQQAATAAAAARAG
jgi:hypothetical protein